MLVWPWSRVLQQKALWRRKKCHEIPLHLLPSPKLPHPSFIPRESVLPLLFSGCFQPFGLNHTQRPGSRPNVFFGRQWMDQPGPDAHTWMRKNLGTERTWKRGESMITSQHDSSRPSRELFQGLPHFILIAILPGIKFSFF